MSSKLSMHVPLLGAFWQHVRGTVVVARAGLQGALAAFPQNDVAPSQTLPSQLLLLSLSWKDCSPLPEFSRVASGTTWLALAWLHYCVHDVADPRMSDSSRSSFYSLPYSSTALLPSSDLGHQSDSPIIGLR